MKKKHLPIFALIFTLLFTTFISPLQTFASSDTTAPTLDISPRSGNISSDTRITIEASDESGIHHIGYAWDDASTEYVNATSATTRAPSSTGTHELHVYAKDCSTNYNNTGWKTYKYTIGSSSSSDTTAPTLNVSPNSGNISAGSTITVTASDSSGIHHIGYAWGNGSTQYANASSANITAPSSSGTHELHVYAKDNSSNLNNTGWKNYTYIVGSNDTTSPTLTVTPNSSSIYPNSTITIYAYDSSGIYQIGYSWDYNSTTIINSNTVTTTAPSSTGQHKLYIYAKDNSTNHNDTGMRTFYYNVGGTIDYPGNEYPGAPGEGIINPQIKTLKVELRNGADRIKYSVNEEILYYVDYYNGTNSQQQQVEATFNIPSGFTVTDSNQGTVSNNTIIWNLGTLNPLQSGRLPIKIKCETLSSPERVVILSASLKQNGVIKDSSLLQNMIFRTDSKGYHKKYIGGYPDGSFRPERGMTRAEFAAMLVRIFNIEMAGNTNSYINTYRDVNAKKSSWAYDAILACSREGLFSGYPDGTFRPNSVVTRAEFSAVLARKLNINNTLPIWLHANDLKNHWGMNEMEQLIRFKIIYGYPDGSAKPDRHISRAEAVTMLNRFTFRGKLDTSTSSFWDVRVNHWAHAEIEESARNHNYMRTSNGDETISY